MARPHGGGSFSYKNKINYSAERSKNGNSDEGDIRNGVLTIGHESGHYYVLCGNAVMQSSIDMLKNHLESLRSLNKNELKSLYRERRKKAASPESKGAGLEFIEMARKASLPIEYEFVPMGEDQSFFCLKVII